jgi:hypothetical protein
MVEGLPEDAAMIAFPKHAAERRFFATMSVVAAAVIVAGSSNTCGPG